MYAQPGKKLLFMGCEFAQPNEWKHDHSLDWHLTQYAPHEGMMKWVADLNHLYRNEPTLHERDFSSEGFRWIVGDDSANSVLVFLRLGEWGRPVFLIACNFSFNVFKERKGLIDYLRLAQHSLSKDGLMLLEVAGGPGMIERVRERKFFHRAGKWHFTYVWDQQEFDPISHEARYAIHFKFPDGGKIDEAFVYDWRLWTIPELREALADAGFTRSVVYWETSHKGKGTGEYVISDKGENDYAWVAYVVGVK